MVLELIPAIDIRGARAVRLTQGDYDRETVFDHDPLVAAQRWADGGAAALHVVDLDGARSGRPVNLEHLRRICEAVEVPVQFGGGLRTAEAVTEALEAGADRVVLGTAALADPALIEALAVDRAERIVASVDARNGRVAVEGWERETAATPAAMIDDLGERGVARFLYTPVEVDGTLQGPALEELPGVASAAAAVGAELIYSGGVGSLEDLRALARLGLEALAGVIVGRALYDARFTVAEGQAALGRALASAHVLVAGPGHRPGRHAGQAPLQPARARRARAAGAARARLAGTPAQEPLRQRAGGDAAPGPQAGTGSIRPRRPRRRARPGAPQGLSMALKRVIPCLDVDRGRVVKGTNFVGLRDAGDPVELAERYDAEGADELVFLDITASARAARDDRRAGTADRRQRLHPVHDRGRDQRRRPTHRRCSTPGADKVSVNSSALARPQLIDELVEVFGSQCVVVAIDAKRNDSAWDVYVDGGRTRVEGREAVAWAIEATERGAGEVLLTSMDRDGTTDGYDLELTRAVADAVTVPVIASGGAGELSHLVDAIVDGRGGGGARAPRSSTYGKYSVAEAKEAMREAGIPVRVENPATDALFTVSVNKASIGRGAALLALLPFLLLVLRLAGVVVVLEGAEPRGAGEIEAVAVGDHRVVLAELVLEDLVAVLGVEAEGADVGTDARDVDGLADDARGAEDDRRPGPAPSARRRSSRRGRRSACPSSRCRRSAGAFGVSATAGAG